MLDNMPVTIMAKNYSHCPLKKRPVPLLDACSGVYTVNVFGKVGYLANIFRQSS